MKYATAKNSKHSRSKRSQSLWSQYHTYLTLNSSPRRSVTYCSNRHNCKRTSRAWRLHMSNTLSVSTYAVGSVSTITKSVSYLASRSDSNLSFLLWLERKEGEYERAKAQPSTDERKAVLQGKLKKACLEYMEKAVDYQVCCIVFAQTKKSAFTEHTVYFIRIRIVNEHDWLLKQSHTKSDKLNSKVTRPILETYANKVMRNWKNVNVDMMKVSANAM